MRWAAMACGCTKTNCPLNLVAGFLGFKDLLLGKDFQNFSKSCRRSFEQIFTSSLHWFIIVTFKYELHSQPGKQVCLFPVFPELFLLPIKKTKLPEKKGV